MSILIYDSGVGGISVLSEAVKLLDKAKFIYFADTLNMPYGSKGDRELYIIAEKNLLYLIEKYSVDIVVIACNTLTAAAVTQLRYRFSDVEFIGIEPANKVAARDFERGLIYVLARVSTVKSGRISERFAQYSQRLRLIAMDKLAELIEARVASSKLIEYLQNQSLCIRSGDDIISQNKPYPIVLGCTHYSLIKEEISKVFKGAVIYDGNKGTAKRICVVAKERKCDENKEFGVVVVTSCGKNEEIQKINELFDSYSCKN
ncbi:MAG: aspartate/glutamate racemase family protein [Clostridia bacterium]